MQLRLRELRVARGLTQRDVAEAASYSVSYVTEVEGGKKQANARFLDRAAKALTALGSGKGFGPVSPRDLILDEAEPTDAERIRRIQTLSEAQLEVLDEVLKHPVLLNALAEMRRTQTNKPG